MENLSLIDTFSEFKELKNIDRPTMMSVLEEIFRNMLIKMYGSTDNFDIIINIDKGDFEIWRRRTVVEEVEDENSQISLKEVHEKDNSYEIGEDYTEEVKLQSFGRRSILALRQNLAGRIMDLEKANLFNKYKDKVGQIIVGEVYQAWKRETLVLDDEGNELVLSRTEMIPGDFYRKGDTLKAIIMSVEMRNSTPFIMLSRTSPAFLEKLFEQEVPEIADGLIVIKNAVRAPGERAKITVESYDDRVDPVGACVGVKGSRIHSIVKELRNENIDVINYTANVGLLIQRSLSPAKVTSVTLHEDEKKADVFLKPNEVSLAIGKGGLNIRLAGLLVGYEIDVYRDNLVGVEEEDDVNLDEFSDEIEPWVLSTIKSIGCDTAKNVLALSKEELIKRTDLEEETIDELLSILKSEFE